MTPDAALEDMRLVWTHGYEALIVPTLSRSTRRRPVQRLAVFHSLTLGLGRSTDELGAWIDSMRAAPEITPIEWL